MKAVLISIQPKWCELICSGKKTVEVRKTKPKSETPFKVYIYCTKGKPLMKTASNTCFIDNSYTEGENLYGLYELVNGKVIGEFVCDKVVQFENDCYTPAFEETADLSCVGYKGLYDYLGAQEYGYGWHITDLVIYYKPKELSEFYVEGDCDCMNCRNCAWFDRGNGYNVEDDCNLAYKGADEHKSYKPIKRPFQSWGYVEELKGEN
jgi:predicted transcriptional regulator